MKVHNNSIESKMKMFIIPNHATLVDEFIFDAAEKKRYYTELSKINESEFDPDKDRIVQLWFVEDENEGCDNMCDHLFRIEDDDTVWMGKIDHPGLPSPILKDIHEGDTISIKLPVRAFRRDKRSDEKYFILNATITADQNSYRYSRFGNFEEVFNQVI